ncbi:hypothetical protein C8R46DRAFT_1026818 [Mycena filopes]|nr:hypothetical protein C8R46DRAFT_1026818 [Mycena filopes]
MFEGRDEGKDEVPTCSSNYGSREYESTNGARRTLNDVTDVDKAAAQAPTANGRERRRARKREATRHMKHATVTRLVRRVRYDGGCGARNRTTTLRGTTAARASCLWMKESGTTSLDEAAARASHLWTRAPAHTRRERKSGYGACKERNDIAGRGSRTSKLPVDEMAQQESVAAPTTGLMQGHNPRTLCGARNNNERKCAWVTRTRARPGGASRDSRRAADAVRKRECEAVAKMRPAW